MTNVRLNEARLTRQAFKVRDIVLITFETKNSTHDSQA